MIFTILLINIPLFRFKEAPKKLIIEKNILIDDCSKDDVYKYEYNNICYTSCPRGTQVSKNNKNLCENKYQMSNTINITNNRYEINNSSSSVNNILNKAEFRKLQDNNENDILEELRNKIETSEDSDIKDLLEGRINEIRKTDNAITYQIITSNNQNNFDSDKISTLELGECENILKNYFIIREDAPLIIFKFDYYKEGLLVPIIEYEIYDSVTRDKLILTPCKNIPIEISVPLLTKKEEEPCIQLCDENCVYLYYSPNNKKYNCKCEFKEEMTLITNISPQSWNKEGFFKRFCEIKNDDVNLNKNEIVEALVQEFNKGTLNKLLPDVISGNDIVIEKKDIIFQITTTINQIYNNYNNLSTIDLNECENKLRELYNIEVNAPLFMLKIDSYNENSPIQVEYEVCHHNENNNEFFALSLEICKDIKININLPKYLSETEIGEYIASNGDVCYSYKSENGKDISLKDRKKELKFECESNCDFIGYNTSNNMMICECEVKLGISEIKIDKNVELVSMESNESNESDKSISLFDCVGYFFSKNGFQNNSGSYILLCLISFNIIFVIYYQSSRRRALQNEIDKFLSFNQISNYNNAVINNNIFNNGYNINNGYYINNGYNINNENNINNGYNINNENNINNGSNINNENNINNGYINNQNSNDITHFNVENNNPSKSKKKQIRSNKRKTSQKSNKGKVNNVPQISSPPKKSKINKKIGELNANANSFQKPDSNMEFRNIENQGNINMQVLNNDINNNYNLQVNNQINNQIINNGVMQTFYFNDYELNHMNYNEALLYDKRTYFQYYLSLIKTGNQLYFTFILKTDYNPILLKATIFVLSFSLLFLFNTLLFGEVSIINKKNYSISYQMPQIIYSVILSAILTGITKYFVLPEENIAELRYVKVKEMLNAQIIKFKNKTSCKHILYFLVDFILLLFIWFYVSLFCAVYRNTQNFLIEIVFISLAFYLLYPFVLAIAPICLRIPSLKSEKRNKQCFFKLSKIIAALIYLI